MYNLPQPALARSLLIPTKNIVISTEGGAFAAAAEKPASLPALFNYSET
jgi:hypothetical protein